MNRTLLPSLLLFCVSPMPVARGSLNLVVLNAPVDVAFTGFTAPTIWASSSPGPGQLDSDLWSINSESSLTTTAAAFGSDQTGGQGSSTGSETTSGTYAFDVGGGVTALGVQATGTFWTPGMFTLRLQNTTGGPVTSLNVAWTTWVFNDQGRSNRLGLYHSADNATYTSAGAAFDVVSPDVADTAPVAWQSTPRSFTIEGLTLADGDTYYIRWGGDDVGGTGSRDELALGSLQITPVPEPTVVVFLGFGCLGLLARRR